MKYTALIDGDIVAYQTAAWAHARMVDGMDMLDRLHNQVDEWIKRAGCSRAFVCLSCSREDNFRRDFWPEYKAHRTDHMDPPGRASCVEALLNNWPSLTRPRIEADDIMGILGSLKKMPDGSVPVIVTIDKDLQQVPGHHFNPDKDTEVRTVDLATADRFFYQQWMTGDATDNIPGLFRVGPAKAGKILDATDRADWDAAVQQEYANHPKGYPKDYCLAMARCVRILRSGEWDVAKRKPILWSLATA